MEPQDIIEKVSKITPEWLAGFFDGEGCINARFTSGVPSLRVTLTQKEPSIILAISLKYSGGLIHPLKHKLKDDKSQTITYCLTYNGNNSVNILKAIEPFVIVKKAQIVLALEFSKFITYSGGKLTQEERERKFQIMREITYINRRNMASEPLEGAIQ